VSGQDEFKVLQLLSRYAFAIDTKDPDTVASLFTEDGAFVSPIDGTARGRVEIRELIARKRDRLRATPGAFKRHYVTHPLVELDGDRGTFQAGMLETQAEHGSVKVILTGHYKGVIVKELDGQWRFAERQCIPDPL
jgi:ketosteroid isomerase-like protein